MPRQPNKSALPPARVGRCRPVEAMTQGSGNALAALMVAREAPTQRVLVDWVVGRAPVQTEIAAARRGYDSGLPWTLGPRSESQSARCLLLLSARSAARCTRRRRLGVQVEVDGPAPQPQLFFERPAA